MPRTSISAPQQVLSTRIDAGLYATLVALADRQYAPLSAVVRQALHAYVEEQGLSPSIAKTEHQHRLIETTLSQLESGDLDPAGVFTPEELTTILTEEQKQRYYAAMRQKSAGFRPASASRPLSRVPDVTDDDDGSEG